MQKLKTCNLQNDKSVYHNLFRQGHYGNYQQQQQQQKMVTLFQLEKKLPSSQ